MSITQLTKKKIILKNSNFFWPTIYTVSRKKTSWTLSIKTWKRIISF